MERDAPAAAPLSLQQGQAEMEIAGTQVDLLAGTAPVHPNRADADLPGIDLARGRCRDLKAVDRPFIMIL